jgi:hypothetical protein
MPIFVSEKRYAEVTAHVCWAAAVTVLLCTVLSMLRFKRVL